MKNMIWIGILTLVFIFLLMQSGSFGFSLAGLVVYVFAVIYLLIRSKEKYQKVN
jgi:hypothetical protein